MLSAIAALFMYVMDWRLAIIIAVVGPAVEAMDTSGTHANLLVLLLASVAVYIVRSLSGFDERTG